MNNVATIFTIELHSLQLLGSCHTSTNILAFYCNSGMKKKGTTTLNMIELSQNPAKSFEDESLIRNFLRYNLTNLAYYKFVIFFFYSCKHIKYINFANLTIGINNFTYIFVALW